MPSMITRVRSRPVLWFWLIGTALEVVLAAALLLSGGDAAIERALQAAGLPFNTDLVTALRLCVAFPGSIVGVVLSLAQVAAPDLAVLVAARRIRSGPGSLAAVRARFRFWGPELGVRRGLTVWAQMIAVFIGLSLATAALNLIFLRPGEYHWAAPELRPGLAGALLVAMFLDAGALLEENGWRGFALPLLLRRFTPLTASLVLGLAWAAWHYPVKYNALTDYGLGGLGYLAAFTLKIVLLTIVMTWFWQRSGGATLIAIAMHGLSNDSLRLQGELIGESLRLSIVSELTICLPLAAVAAVLVFRAPWISCAPGPSETGRTDSVPG